MHLHLIVPALFWSGDDPIAAHDNMAVAGLETLIARGRKRVRPTGSLEAWLLEAFGIAATDALPIAPFALVGDGLAHESRYWMRVDPVHLRVGRDNFTLLDATTFALEQDEANAFVGVLNHHFRAEGMQFFAPTPTRWYWSGPAPVLSATTTTLDQARGRSVDALRPTGPGALALQAFMNEVQMLLHQHPLNETRAQRGLPPVNSVWPWGAGHASETSAPRLAAIHADDPLALGLARTAGIGAHPLPHDLAQILAAPTAEGVVWIILDRLRAPCAYGDAQAWRATLMELEARWFAPALEALRRRRLGMLTIHAVGPSSSLATEATASDLRYFWRRRKNLAAYINRPDSP